MPVTKQIVVRHRSGLQGRIASLFVTNANKYDSNITVQNVNKETPAVNGKSIISLITVSIEKGDTVRLQAEGPDEQQALDGLSNLIATNFGEAG